ncbi:MAG: hypothetical protein OXF93_21815 [Acidobacteria bacterium]|nr:hypothetical protein [Acidobacteriota bacterium]
MVVAFDADILCLLLRPSIRPPLDPGTGHPVEHARARHLVAELESGAARIVIPAPALAEFLVVAGDDGPDYIKVIDKQAVMRIEPFDTVAAIEAAASTRAARVRGVVVAPLWKTSYCSTSRFLPGRQIVRVVVFVPWPDADCVDGTLGYPRPKLSRYQLAPFAEGICLPGDLPMNMG